MFQDKAQSAANGCSLGKGYNAVLGYLGGSLWARQYAAIYVVAFLMKGTTLHCKSRRIADRILTR
jgi:hypothetical protein